MLKEKVAIITGGTRGIGLEIVKVFNENNAKVILFGSKKETVDKAISDLAQENIMVEGYYPNLSNPQEIEEVIKEIIKKHGKIDILVNNAGISANKKIEDIVIKDISLYLEDELVETAMTESEIAKGFHLAWADIDTIIEANERLMTEKWQFRDVEFLKWYKANYM